MAPDPDKRVALAGSGDVAHERIVSAVRKLLDEKLTSQRQLADLLECDVSSINRGLLLEDSGPRKRRREWRAKEVFAMAVFFELPVEFFYSTNIEEMWEEQMRKARADHNLLVNLLKDES